MYNNKKIIGIIPARGGSKGLPGKNIKLLLGKPLIGWTIESALASRYLDKVIVSTDSKEIAEISERYYAEVPFLRPEELASDNAQTIDVIIHALDWAEANDNAHEIIILLQPTSPLRTAQDIDNIIELLFSKKAKAVVSVCETDHHPYWTNTLPPNGCMKDFIKDDAIKKNRQALPTFYRLNGALYIAYLSYLKIQKSFWGPETYAYIMPRERSVDIDSLIDLKFAEFLLKHQRENW